MAVKALKDYKFAPADTQDKFPPGTQLTYIGWDQHTMFCSPFCLPLPGEMPFGALTAEVIPGAIAQHPDAEKVEWDKVEWMLDGEKFTPDMSKSLKANGLVHKSVIRFRTPGLDGIEHSGT